MIDFKSTFPVKLFSFFMIVAFHILRIYIFYISYISFFPSLPQLCLCAMNHGGSFAGAQGVTFHLSVKLRGYQDDTSTFSSCSDTKLFDVIFEITVVVILQTFRYSLKGVDSSKFFFQTFDYFCLKRSQPVKSLKYIH